MVATRRILIGQIGPAHGVRGEVIVRSFAGVPEDIAAYGDLTDAAGARSFTITALKWAGERLVARLLGIDDRHAAEALRGVELYVDRKQLPPAAAGEWYHADLIGLTVLDETGASIGAVTAIANYGAGDLIEIRPAGGGDTLLLPFNDDCVPVVDIAAGHIIVRIPGETGGGEQEDDA